MFIGIAGKVRLHYKTMLALSVPFLSSCVFLSIESDRSLLRKFDKHRPLFEQFIALENQKEAFSISNFNGRCAPSEEARRFSQEELEGFCNTMRRMGVESIYGSELGVEFLASRESYTEHKSYIFRTSSPSPSSFIVEDLDKMTTLGDWYRHIEGSWYLYLRRDD